VATVGACAGGLDQVPAGTGRQRGNPCGIGAPGGRPGSCV